MKKWTSLLFFFGGVCLQSVAQTSYVYIEGIKGIPFNILLEGKPIDKPGQNYVLLNFKEPGEKNIDITFVNTNFPKQHFVVDVQAQSSYGYRMGKTDENRFYLIDIVNDGKLIESNSKIDLALSTPSNVIAMYRMIQSELETNNEKPSPRVNDSVTGFLKKRRSRERAKTSAIQTVEITKGVKGETQVTSKGPETPGQVVANKPDPTRDEEDKSSAPSQQQANVRRERIMGNKDCIKNATEAEISGLLDKIETKPDDEDKLIVIKKRILTGCFNANQVYALAEKFNSQYGILSLVKFVLPLTSDPQNLIKIEPLLKFETNRAKLIRLLER